jgi:hypothetical protein
MNLPLTRLEKTPVERRESGITSYVLGCVLMLALVGMPLAIRVLAFVNWS